MTKDVTAALVGTGRGRARGGRHVLAAKCKNEGGPAGLLVRLTMKTRAGDPITIVSDDSWKSSGAAEQSGWSGPGFDDQGWSKAVALANLGGGAWASVNEAALAAAEQEGEPQAPAAEGFKVAKGFKVELLYSVPKDEQGSWVNMCVDPKGRLIVSDQYGELYRVTPPAPGGDPATTKVEPIDVAIGEAQGLLWAFDSLYVVVNRGEKYQSGLYRVTRHRTATTTSTRSSCSALLDGGGEHGPHAVILVARRQVALRRLRQRHEADRARPARACRGSGARTTCCRACPTATASWRTCSPPAAASTSVDPDGKNWELVSIGFRNQYDARLQPPRRPVHLRRRHGVGLQHAVVSADARLPGRSAAPSSAGATARASGRRTTPTACPPTVNIGPGSPTGVGFGYGAKFPAKYQDALFICDWSYGKLYAVHLTPEASATRPSSRSSSPARRCR